MTDKSADDVLREMNQKYPEFLAAERRQRLDSANVPDGLRCYVPFAEIWGVSDDLDRESLVERAPDAAKQDLMRLIAQIDDELDDWLAGSEADGRELSREYIAFSAMRMAADFV